MAAERGCFNIVKYLVDQEVDINIQDHNGVSECWCRQSGTAELISLYNAERLSFLGLKMIRTHHQIIYLLPTSSLLHYKVSQFLKHMR